MKKIPLLLLAFVCLISLFSCGKFQVSEGQTDIPDSTQESDITISDHLSEYLTYENGKQCLVLPISKDKVFIHDEYKNQLGNIDIELLKYAEETITDKMSAYTDVPEFFLQFDNSGYLCLYTEWIADIDPPNIVTDENGEIIDSGCDIDHKHIFFSERITK